MNPGSAESNYSPTQEMILLERLRMGDEEAFMMLVNDYQTMLVRLARMYLSDAHLIDEAIQETWIGVLRGLDRFEGRSSLKTWIFSILMNRAKTLAQREIRHAHLLLHDEEDTRSTVPADRFYGANMGDMSGEWVTIPRSWEDVPEQQLLSKETMHIIHQAIQTLPTNQREVITLRDLEQLSAPEVCNVMRISESNQRVLLHRARAKVRAALERYFGM